LSAFLNPTLVLPALPVATTPPPPPFSTLVDQCADSTTRSAARPNRRHQHSALALPSIHSESSPNQTALFSCSVSSQHHFSLTSSHTNNTPTTAGNQHDHNLISIHLALLCSPEQLTTRSPSHVLYCTIVIRSFNRNYYNYHNWHLACSMRHRRRALSSPFSTCFVYARAHFAPHSPHPQTTANTPIDTIEGLHALDTLSPIITITTIIIIILS
jgi:hypothetical protein